MVSLSSSIRLLSCALFFSLLLFGTVKLSASADEEAKGRAEAALSADAGFSQLLDAVDVFAKNPDALQRAVDDALTRARSRQQQKEDELKRLHERLQLLKETQPLLDAVRQSAPPPETASPPNAVEEVHAENNPAQQQPAGPSQLSPISPLSEKTHQQFAKRFDEEVFPLLTEGQQNCFTCHGSANKSQLTMAQDSGQAFLKLLAKDYFNPRNPMSLPAKLEAENEDVRMPPPPFKRWDEEKIETVRQFSRDIISAMGDNKIPFDEQFPVELMEEYAPPENQPLAKANDNTFLTYYQLKKKIKAIFNDDWKRGEVDKFQENIALFQGADFYTRFNESDTPSAKYLTGLDLLAADVASKAYLNRTGPFESLPADLPSPNGMEKPDEAYRSAISQVYRKLLYRDPTAFEMQQSFLMIKTIYGNHDGWKDGDYTLNFELDVTGDSGVVTNRAFQVKVNNTPHTLHQQWLDQNTEEDGELVSAKLDRTFQLKAGDEDQAFILSNLDSQGLVSFTGIEIIGPLPSDEKKTIAVDAPGVKLKGPWDVRDAKGVKVIDDGNEHKGECSVQVPISVGQDGEYEIRVQWFDKTRRNRRGREQSDMSPAVLVEVLSHDRNEFVKPLIPDQPPKGEAHFMMDQTPDTIAFWDVNTSFRFGADDYVEINNKETQKRVTADAVKFIAKETGQEILLDDNEAEGIENWHVFTEYAFRPYHITGRTSVNDRIERKGELFLRYKPSKHKDEWQEGQFYEVHIGFPGQASNETAVPIIIKANASSPIVRMTYPHRVPVNSQIEIDAAKSYDIQNSELKFNWVQVGGPKVEISDPHAASPQLTVHHRTPHQAAWEGLVRALVRHPDFTFTRPFSIEEITQERVENRLHLVNISQDLVGRPPTDDELKALDGGTSLSGMIDHYLASDEFKDFYFHRIRLFLESQGTDEEDEPARLWSYIAFNDRPFKEIITADYTVNKNFEKIDRPAYYGKTGILTMKGFIKGKPGLPHFNYAAVVGEKFLGYVFEVSPDIIDQRDGVTAASTTDPSSACYSCHKFLTPFAFQRMHWSDSGDFRTHDDRGLPIDHSDQQLVESYPFKGDGMEAFSLVAQNKERFIRTMIDTHFQFFMGRQMRFEEDERDLYRRLWVTAHEQGFAIKGLIKAILESPEYLGKERGHDTPKTISKAGR